VEGGGDPFSDRHVVVLQEETCLLFELFMAVRDGTGWRCASSARFDLGVDHSRPESFISALASGTAILPGLVKYKEIEEGEIRHAIGFTLPRAQNAFADPATHLGPPPPANQHCALPPYGLRVRLKASVDISSLSGPDRVIAEALKRYGMIFVDQGIPWLLLGSSDPRFPPELGEQLRMIRGSDFEVVATGAITRGYTPTDCP
jgi:hypothetical protein